MRLFNTNFKIYLVCNLFQMILKYLYIYIIRIYINHTSYSYDLLRQDILSDT